MMINTVMVAVLKAVKSLFRKKIFCGAWLVSAFLSFGIIGRAIAAPVAVTDLNAAVGPAGGEIVLNWHWGTAFTTGYYVIQYSTGIVAFSTANAQVRIATTAVTVQLQSYKIVNLTPGDTYYAVVWGINSSSQCSLISNTTSTWAQAAGVSTPTAPTNLSRITLSSSSIKWTWTDNAADETAYKIRNGGCGGNILYTLSPNTTEYLETGLTANTSYYRSVESANAKGHSVCISSGSDSLNGVYTFAAAPNNLYVVSRSSRHVSLAWQSGGNMSSATRWGLERSVFSNFSSVTVLTSTIVVLQHIDSGLTEKTTYYYRVRGINGEGYAGSYGVGVSTIALSTPVAPGGFGGVARSETSIYWTWNALPSNVAGCRLKNSSGNIIASLPASSTFFTESGLGNNEATFRYLEAVNDAGSSPVVSAVAYTWSMPPMMDQALEVTSFSVRVAWSSNGNPVGTDWGIERSTDINGPHTVLTNFDSHYRDTVYVDTGLPPSTFYAYWIKSYSGQGRPSESLYNGAITGPAIAPDTVLPAAVNDLRATQGVNPGELLLRWTAPGDDGNTGDITGGQIKVQYVTRSTVAFNISQAQISQSTTMVAGSTQSYLISGLSLGVTYYLTLWTKDEYPYTANWSALSNKTTAWAQVPSHPLSPVNFSGVTAGTDSIKWSWTPSLYHDGYRFLDVSGVFISSISAQATYYVETGLVANSIYSRYLQAYNFSGTAASIVASRCTLAQAPTDLLALGVYFSSVTVGWTVNGRSIGNLHFLEYWGISGSTISISTSAMAVTIAGLNDNASYYFRVGVENSEGIVSWDQNALSLLTFKLPEISTTVPLGGMHLHLQQASGPADVYILPATFSQPVVVSIKTPLTYPSEQAGNVGKASMAGLEILTDLHVQPARPVTITISYSDLDVPGLDATKLAIARYDEARAAWLVLPSVVDTLAKTVTAKTEHFSMFRIFEINPSQTILKAVAYPNPFRPTLGHTQISFKNLPAGAVLKIYAFDGAKVRAITCNASGFAVWDVKNTSGRDVASGVYFVYIEKGTDSKIMSLVVQR